MSLISCERPDAMRTLHFLQPRARHKLARSTACTTQPTIPIAPNRTTRVLMSVRLFHQRTRCFSFKVLCCRTGESASGDFSLASRTVAFRKANLLISIGWCPGFRPESRFRLGLTGSSSSSTVMAPWKKVTTCYSANPWFGFIKTLPSWRSEIRIFIITMSQLVKCTTW